MNVRLVFAILAVIGAAIAVARRQQSPTLPPAESGSWTVVSAPAAR